jgi:hypothetical protein
MADTADRVFRNRARENIPQMNGGKLATLGRFSRTVGDVDQLVSQNAHAAGRASGASGDTSDRVQDVVLIFAETRSVSIVIPFACKPGGDFALTIESARASKPDTRRMPF